LLAVVADEQDARLPIDARASVIVVATQLEALQAMIGSGAGRPRCFLDR